MARARDLPELDCDRPLRLAAAQAIAVRSAELFEHAESALDLEEVERVHDLRVATRRLRAALEVFEPCFPSKRRRGALKQVKALADALGERRDRDVQIEFLETFAREAPQEDRAALSALLGELSKERRRASQALAGFMAEGSLKQLQSLLAGLARVESR